MLNPSAPNFLRSRVTPWNTHRENSRYLNTSGCGGEGNEGGGGGGGGGDVGREEVGRGRRRGQEGGGKDRESWLTPAGHFVQARRYTGKTLAL